MSYCDERGRLTTRVPGIIERGAQRSVVTVRNVSIAGAMIEVAPPPDDGEALSFESEMTGKVDARVVWVLGNRCGLLFESIVSLRVDDANDVTASDVAA